MLSVNKLKELVCLAEDLNLVINYFFDMMDAKLLPSSSIAATGAPDMEIQVLLESVHKVVDDHFKLQTKVVNPMLELTKDKQIIHGLYFLSGGGSQIANPISMLYLREAKIAIAFVYHNNNTEMWRLRLQDISEITHH